MLQKPSGVETPQNVQTANSGQYLTLDLWAQRPPGPLNFNVGELGSLHHKTKSKSAKLVINIEIGGPGENL